MATQQITGLVSGFDTASIVEQLMSIQSANYNKVSEKVQTEKVKLQAYQSINSMLLSLKTSVNSLSSQSLWNGKTTTSTNESSLKATATQYAVEGSYSLRVGQLATTTQYMTKGFASSTSTVITSGSDKQNGIITLESSKARVDTSAKLEELNGGKGIYRGSIRVTDAAGASCTVDVSACETLDQVISAINSAAGVQVEARIKQNDDGTSAGNQLEIVDTSGGAGSLKIQNVGQGTTATDLGIAGSSTEVNGVKSIVGSNIYYMSSNTLLSNLNDGLGVEEGMMCITVNNGLGGELDVYVDLNNTSTVADILNSVNSALKEAAAGDDTYAGLADGLKLAINDDKNGFTLTGGQAGRTYTISNVWGQNESGELAMANPQTVNQLGLLGTFYVANDGDGIDGKRIMGDASSPMLTNISGANQTGIGSDSSSQKVSADTLDADTLLKDLNGGKGIDVSGGLNIYFYEGGGDSVRVINALVDENKLRALATTDGATLGDLVTYVNNCLSGSGVAGLEDLQLKIDSDARGVYLDGLSSAHDYGFDGNLADSLGLTGLYYGSETGDTALGDLYAVESIGANGGQNMILEGTKLSELTIGGVDITQADLDSILVAGGVELRVGTAYGDVLVSVDLSGLTGDSTVEEFYGEINAAIQEQVAAAHPDANVPALIIDYTSMGLNWRNVDLGNDLEVTGAAASLLGFDKNYAPQGYSTADTGVNKNLNPVVTGTSTAIDLSSGQTLASLNAGQGLSLDGTQLTLTFGPEGNQAIVSVSRDELISALGGHYGSATVNDYLSALNTLFNDKINAHASLNGTGASVTFGLSADGSGITILNADGANDGDPIALGGDMAKASSTGLTAAAMTGGAGFVSPEATDIRGVTATGVEVKGLGYINMEIDGQSVQLNTDGLDKYNTLNDLIGHLNKQLADLGHGDMYFGVSDSGSGLSFTNDSNHEVVFKYDAVSTLASDLGLAGTAAEKTDTTVTGQSHLNGSSLNRNYVGRATTLASLNGGAGADKGIITVTNAQGTSVNIDLSDALTVGDVIDAINGTLYGVKARINDAGDGIVIEQSEPYNSDGSLAAGQITVTGADSLNTAKHLGIAGTGTRGDDGVSVLNGSMKTVIEVGPNDTLTDLMNRISNLGAGYKTSIINDGTGGNSYRLSITAGASGSGNDFIIDTDLDILGFQQVSKGQDSILLYGQADSGMSPIMLKSSTNTNNQAIAGLTFEMSEVSDTYTTITVKTDTEAVVEEIKNMVQAYNDLSDLITYLDGYDYENDTKGILFGDSTIRNLMSTIDEMFYQVFNPDNLSYSDISASGTKSTWTWSDLGISFSTNNTASDESGSWYSRMDLDLDALDDMVTNNWDQLYQMMASQRNASDSTLAKNVAATSSFNFKYDVDENGNVIKPENQDDPNNAINGDKSSSAFGASNGFTANKTIEEGENEYTIYFQGATTIDRVSIYHPNSSEYPASEYSLKDFTVEYLDANTGKWETLREVSGNSGASTILGLGQPTSVLGIRITGTATNAEDGKFRLLDVQCLESTGLAGKLNTVINSLTDVVDGYFTTANEEVESKITDLEDQMEKLAERLTAKEQQLWNKFNAMESALSTLQNQSSYLSTMFSSLNSSSSSS